MASSLSFPAAFPAKPAMTARPQRASRATVRVQAAEGSSPDVCPSCGVPMSEARCDGTGRIAGGVGSVLTWWPIKAYKPCPDLVASGKQYTRRGQSLDEVAFGRKGQGDDMSLEDRLKGK